MRKAIAIGWGRTIRQQSNSSVEVRCSKNHEQEMGGYAVNFVSRTWAFYAIKFVRQSWKFTPSNSRARTGILWVKIHCPNSK